MRCGSVDSLAGNVDEARTSGSARAHAKASLMTVDEHPKSVVLDLSIEPTTVVSTLRGRLTTVLHDLGEDHRYDVLLVVTELVSNVLDHTPGTGRLRVFSSTVRCEITVEVDDTSALQPVHGRSLLGGTRGRGITVVDKLAREWGTWPLHDGGKTVFASITCAGDGNASPDPMTSSGGPAASSTYR